MEAIRLGFVKLATIDDIPDGEMLGVEVNGKDILIANLGGKFHAMDNSCTHMGCRLSDGRVYDKVVMCICHGSRFDLLTGSVVEGPAADPEPTYSVRIDGRDIMVEL